MPEEVVAFIVYQLLDLVAQLHEANLIHADIKIDNMIVFTSNTTSASVSGGGMSTKQLTTFDDHPLMPSGEQLPIGVAALDFGRALDVAHVYKECIFTGDHHLKELKPPAMRQKLPWAHSIDTFGIASVAHCLLFGKHLRVRPADPRKEVNAKLLRGGAVAQGMRSSEPRRYVPAEAPKRYHRFRELWGTLFDNLINFSPIFVVEVPGKASPTGHKTGPVGVVGKRSSTMMRELQIDIERAFAEDEALRFSMSDHLREVGQFVSTQCCKL